MDDLKIGSTIGVIAPSGPAKVKVEKVSRALEKKGYKVKIGISCYLKYKGYLAGEDSVRAKDLEDMFLDKEVDTIICLRGGYGATRILEYIDYNIIRNNPKKFIGFSDITALHIVFNQDCNLPTYHGIMAGNFLEWDNFSYISLLRALNFEDNLDIINPVGAEIKSINDGEVSGVLVGGNLTLIISSLGTKYEIDTKGKILFIEDVGEYIYRVDRMLNQLYLAGKFNDCSGIIFGDFNNCRKNNEEIVDIYELIEEIAQKTNKPTMYNLKSGHCIPMVTLPLGYDCIMDATNKKIKIKK